MEIFRNIVSLLLVSIAVIIALGTLCLLLISPSYIILCIFMTIIIWKLTPNSWSTIGWSCVLITACLYLAILFITALSWQPLMYLMSIMLPVCSTLVMLKGKPIWIWIVIFLVYLSVGIYCLYNNDIVGPMEFLIRDRPIDVPAQWYHCYRFFWGAVLLNMISSMAGVISVLILFLYRVRAIWKETVWVYLSTVPSTTNRIW